LKIPINTGRLVLRDFVSEEWADVLAYQSDARFVPFYPWTHRTEEDARAFVQMFVGQQQVKPRRKFQLAITLPGDSRVMARVGSDVTRKTSGKGTSVMNWRPSSGNAGMPPKPP